MQAHVNSLPLLLNKNFEALGEGYQHLFTKEAQLSCQNEWQIAPQYKIKKPPERLAELDDLAKKIILCPDASQIPHPAAFVARFNEEWTALREKIHGKLSNASENGALLFNSKEQPYSWLSNFFPTLIFDGERIFYSAEHAYQAQKFKSENPAVYREIAQGIDPLKAKLLAEKHEPEIPAEQRLKLMQKNVTFKFNQNPRLNQLLGRSSARLIEHTNSAFWGDRLDGTGANHLGKLLEDVRAHLKKSP